MTLSFPVVSFNGGEWAPELHSRTDLPKYYTALRKCRNLIPTPQGAVKSRPGTKPIGLVDNYTSGSSWIPKTARLIPFVFSSAAASESNARSYVLVLEAPIDSSTLHKFQFKVICPAVGDHFLTDPSSEINLNDAAKYKWTYFPDIDAYYLEDTAGGAPPGISALEDVENVLQGPYPDTLLTYCGWSSGYPQTHPGVPPNGLVLVSKEYTWVQEGTSNVYTLRDSSGGDPGIADFPDLYYNAKSNTPLLLTKLDDAVPTSAGQWSYTDKGSTSFKTVYVYLPGGLNPQEQYIGYLYGKFINPIPEKGWAFGPDPTGLFYTVWVNVGAAPAYMKARKTLRIEVEPKGYGSPFEADHLKELRFTQNQGELWLFHRKWSPVRITRGKDDYTWRVRYPIHEKKWRGPVEDMENVLPITGMRILLKSETKWVCYGTDLYYLTNTYGEGIEQRGDATNVYHLDASNQYQIYTKQTPDGADPDSSHQWNMKTVDGLRTVVLYHTSDPNSEADRYFALTYADQEFGVSCVSPDGLEGLPDYPTTKVGLEGSLMWAPIEYTTETEDWTGPDASGEYYTPWGSEPTGVYRDFVALTKGTVGSLSTGQWGWDAVNHRVYVKDDPNGHIMGLGAYYDTYHVYRRFKGKFSWVGTNSKTLSGDSPTWHYYFPLSRITPDATKGPPELLDLLHSDESLEEFPLYLPAVGTFFQQRLLLARSDVAPNRIWGSIVGYADAFTAQNPPREDDAYSFELDSDNTVEILWAANLRDLILGTTGGIWVVTGGPNSAAVTPNNIQAQRQVDWGAWDVAPQVVGASLLWVQAGGQAIRNLSYAQAAMGLMSADLSVLANHLFRDTTIVRMAYQKWPHQALWVVCADGSLRAMVYSEEHQVYAWSRHEAQGATFLDVVSVPAASGGEDLVYFLTERTIESYTRYAVERLQDRFEAGEDPSIMSANAMDYMGRLGDSYSSPVTMVLGLYQLNMQEVDVVADGVYLGRKIVQDGMIPLDGEATRVTVGLPIEKDLLTMDLVFSGQNGTTADKRRGAISVFLSFLETAGKVWVGSEESGKSDLSSLEVADGVLFTGEKEVYIQPANFTESKVYVYSDQPMPLTIRSLYGRGVAGAF